MLERVQAKSKKEAIQYFKKQGYIVDYKRSKTIQKAKGMKVLRGFKLSLARDGIYDVVYYNKH